MAAINPLITQFLHVAINVTDLERAAQFYGQVLGLPLAERHLDFPGLWYQIGSCQIHLIVSANVSHTNVDQRRGRNPHLALGVKDIDTIKTKLTDAGYSCQASHSGRAALFVLDPDANIIELSQV